MTNGKTEDFSFIMFPFQTKNRMAQRYRFPRFDEPSQGLPLPSPLMPGELSTSSPADSELPTLDRCISLTMKMRIGFLMIWRNIRMRSCWVVSWTDGSRLREHGVLPGESYWLHKEGTMYGELFGRGGSHLWKWDGSEPTLLEECFEQWQA